MNMKRFYFAILVFLLCTAFIGAQEARPAEGIIERSRNRISADTISTRSKMILSAKNGTLTERVIDQYSKEDAQGRQRTIVVFQEPASIKGTRFLTIENADKANDQWIYLPSLGRVRRIAASEGGGSFTGSDFSYDDISSAGRKADADTHSILKEEKLGDADCYVIESIPKDADYQYSKMIQWIDKDNFIIHKIELYDKRGSRAKLLEILELREVQGRLSPIVTRMTSLAAGTSTSLNVLLLKYDDPIPEGVFTTNYLETGRPR